MNTERLYVVTLWAPDVDSAAHFYRDVLGLAMLPNHGHRPHFKVGLTLLVIMRSEGPISQTGQSERFPCLALEVEDLDAALEQLNDHKVDLPWGIEEDGDSRWVMFHDPAGNLIELAELV
jgi:catechol-2,3-dioxygenase